jgi:DNA polymerase III delta prime subunit
MVVRLLILLRLMSLAAASQEAASARESAKDGHYKLMILGQTGTGKSTLADAIARHLGYSGKEPAFQSSDAIHAHTQAPASVVVKDVKITDTPGLMDTAGREKDIRNMEMIVNAVGCGVFGVLNSGSAAMRWSVQAKTDSNLHAVIVTLSEVNPRFDSPMQSAC